MRLRAALAILTAAGALGAGTAEAHPHGSAILAPPVVGPWGFGGTYGVWPGAWQPPYTVAMPDQAAPQSPAFDRDLWLRDCRQRFSDNGVDGAVIGGIVGGVAGNAIAGSGDKVLGTVAGAAVGAVAGAAIDKAEDAPRARDRCTEMLDGGMAMLPPGYAVPPGYTMTMVPVMMVPAGGAAARKCIETVVTEEIDEPQPRATRRIPPRAPARRVPDKRIRI
ncbi:glycine zipper 2TM domain-containing protein [Novosphingobium flavum]|nr:glycine zipper 2TM domain-containing protein [Novosphingobium flavum]